MFLLWNEPWRGIDPSTTRRLPRDALIETLLGLTSGSGWYKASLLTTRQFVLTNSFQDLSDAPVIVVVVVVQKKNLQNYSNQ